MTTRTIREDQHGTITGYVYGCRRPCCQSARREYAKEHAGDWAPSADVLDGVYAALEHEADMDGIATASGDRLGELAGISRAWALRAVHQLEASGRIRIVGKVGTRVLEVHLDVA